MQEPTEYAYFSEIFILILALATPVLAAYCIGTLIYFSRVAGFGSSRSSVAAVLATMAAFATTFLIWMALGRTDYELPESLFMVGGFVNSPAVAGCLIVTVVMIIVKVGRRKPEAAV